MNELKNEYESIDNKYIILKSISEGNYGEVYLVNEKNKENIKYAAKILFKDDIYFKEKIDLIIKITNLKSPYIINYIESSKEGKIKLKNCENIFETKQYVIYEYAPKKTICEYLVLPNLNYFEEKHAKIIFKYILKGIQAMHNAGICHRDIKLGNILLDEQFKPKICDFGFSFECKDKKVRKRCGTKYYVAPEILRKIKFKPYDGKKADIFSLGITLLGLVIGIEEEDDSSSKLIQYKEDYDHNKYINIIKTLIENKSPDLQKLIMEMLDFNPTRRPSIQSILNDYLWMNEVKEDNPNQEKDIYKEFKRREDIIEENKIITIQNNNNNKAENEYKNISYQNKSLKNDNENIKEFNKNLIIKNIKENNIILRDYLNINGKLNPLNFMDFIMNQLDNEIKDGIVNPNPNDYIIEVKYQYENDEDDDIEENNEDLNKNEEEEFIDEKYGIFKKDLFIQIILFETENENHILQFYRKEGEIEDYYIKLEKIISIIKKSITIYN